MIEKNQRVNDIEYGNGMVTDIFEHGYFEVTFPNKVLKVLYSSLSKKRYKSNKALTLLASNYQELNRLFADNRPIIDNILKDKQEKIVSSDFKLIFEDSELHFEESLFFIEDTLKATQKGGFFGKNYLSSLGSAFLLNVLYLRGVYVKEVINPPSYIRFEYIKYILLANRYPENKFYQNLEIIFPIFDAEYTWIDLELNRYNPKAFEYFKPIEIDYKGLEFVENNELEDIVIERLKTSKYTNFTTYKGLNYFLVKKSNYSVFIGTTKEFIKFKKNNYLV